MATTGVGFRWLDLLEKEFDKACVGLDTSLGELESDEPEAVYTARQKIATLSSCFAQLTHKALTIFQHSAKLEAELVDMRAELVHARAASAGGCQEAGDMAGNVPDAARARAEAAQLARENAALRETVLALHSELFGARLATKYLDKELAGRIQQLQLLGSEMRAELRDSLWAQVEAEILLQRHKTLVRVCRGRSPRPARPASPRRTAPRTVRVNRSPHLGLGISVTGGREHGVPILISELEAGGPAALTRQLYVGDAILAINDVDLTQACHKEAVQALQSVKGDCALYVQYIATDDDDRLSEDNYRFPLYPDDGEEYCDERDGSGVTPTAPRTPDYNNRCDSEERSCSGSESRYDVYPHAHAHAHPQQHPVYPHPLTYPLPAPAPHPVPAYPDYNNINNNLNILDMDDDSIKIEARLEMVKLEEAEAVAEVVGSPRRSTPRSTPVHLARAANKKRRALDWRTKGAYSAVSVDGVSSDEPGEARRPERRARGPYAALDNGHSSDDDTVDNSPRSNDVCNNAIPQAQEAIIPLKATAISTSATSETATITTSSTVPPTTVTTVATVASSTSIVSNPTAIATSTVPASSTSIVSNPTAIATSTVSPVPKAVTATSSLTSMSTTAVQTSVRRPTTAPSTLQHDLKCKVNGDVKPKKEVKNFRIGSARRVEHSLLNGDGDPDFGTPV